jgi:hypothetical protein
MILQNINPAIFRNQIHTTYQIWEGFGLSGTWFEKTMRVSARIIKKCAKKLKNAFF